MEHRKDLYRYADLKVLGYGSPTTVWRMVKEGKFPAPIDAGGRPAWLPEELHEWKMTRAHIRYGQAVTA